MEYFIVRGRSIDGTVYYAGAGCWADHSNDAMRLTEKEASIAVAERQGKNQECDADSIIGRLEILPA